MLTAATGGFDFLDGWLIAAYAAGCGFLDLRFVVVVIADIVLKPF